MIKCPICDSKLEYKVFDVVAGTIGESITRCKNNCYTEEFAYGVTIISIFDKQFSYSYNTSEEYLEAVIMQKINKEIDYWKKNNRYLMKLMI